MASCRTGDCGAGTEAPLFVDVGGRAHTSQVLPWVAYPVFVRGWPVRTGDVVQFRAGGPDIRRL
jgi:hypothetical protein